MIENTLFILGAFLVARVLGRILDSLFERWLPGESASQHSITEYIPPVPKKPADPAGVSKSYRDYEWL